ncbi:helix-turn-helix transcriptional regulator [Paracoccus caeni]|uniref:Helix-turn-helix transcriptional regulator n=1 Tax=Paracoccus caeni TaxID=657651 RepID=A0A934SGU0_9RHOB|nr:AraC family transcriptional regulator [Paracoccus caeni]MBK4216791.1 helix-turn-helix transcriptional regulator [Paracoccus caeni]
MSAQLFPSFTDWYTTGPLAPYVKTIKSHGNLLTLFEAAQPAGDMSDPAVPDLILYQDMLGGSRVRADMGGGRFAVQSRRGDFYLAAPNYANNVVVSSNHKIRCLSFPTSAWMSTLEAANDGSFSFDLEQLYKGPFTAPSIGTLMQRLWQLADDDDPPSRLLAQAAGCEILAEICRLAGTPFLAVRGGLASWAKRATVDLMHAQLAEDIGLDDLAAAVNLSPFHFSRMFKQSFGMPPRAYLVRLRIERACELLETTDLPVTYIANEVGYSSNQVLARAFVKQKYVTPSEYRRAVRDPRRARVS